MSADLLNILSLQENPKKFEEIIIAQQNKYELEADIKQLLDSIYLEKDRNQSFKRFYESMEFKTICKILSCFGVTINHRICEIGGGPGFLVWALRQAGYQHLELVEPNCYYNTGTGYIRSRHDINTIKFHSDLQMWGSQAEPYDIVITKNCIHHFPNITMSAAAIRQKMRDNALWFAFREWFADTPQELYSLLSNHPYCQPFELYEWPFPASHYAEAIELAGFRLLAVIPYDYANNCLGTWSENEIPAELQTFTEEIDQLLNQNPTQTVEKFWHEVVQNKLHNGQVRLYTRPQMMLFQRIEI